MKSKYVLNSVRLSPQHCLKQQLRKCHSQIIPT